MKRLLILIFTLSLSMSLVACKKDVTPISSENITPQQNTPKDTNNLNQSDPGNTNDIAWWGVWVGDEFSIEITEFDGSSFWFEIINLSNGNNVMSGTSTLYLDNQYMAEYEDVSFSLYEDYSAIDFFASESSQWAFLRGQYMMLDPSNPYNYDMSTDAINFQENDPGDTNYSTQSDPGDTNYSSQSDPGDTDYSTQGDPGDTDVPAWWGVWMGDGFSISIWNFDGQSFKFEISNLRNGSIVLSGTAALYPDNVYMAEYGEISFSLYEDYSAIDFFVSESSEWAHLRGQYTSFE